MPINLSNLFNSQSKNTVLGDFQDLEHLDGLSLSAANAKLYEKHLDKVNLELPFEDQHSFDTYHTYVIKTKFRKKLIRFIFCS